MIVAPKRGRQRPCAGFIAVCTSLRCISDKLVDARRIKTGDEQQKESGINVVGNN